ncbi:hypothetical protein BY458DRAFT_521130 [Sporodiniella umbellata]|nr:hypothetical protein BY458DRAFT_521130 [Sporodiniella umbellata]
MAGKTKIDVEENEKLATQIDASLSMARSLIESWLPAPKAGEKLDDKEEEEEKTLLKYSTGRPDRLGLGAKYLSHAEAMRHTKDDGRVVSKEEMQLKNKILNQNQKASTKHNINKKRVLEEESDSEDESKTGGSKPQEGKKKIGAQGDFLSMYLTERAGKKNKKNKKK